MKWVRAITNSLLVLAFIPGAVIKLLVIVKHAEVVCTTTISTAASPSHHHQPAFLEKFGVLMPRGCNEEAVIYDEVFASRVPIRQPFPMDQ